VQILIVIIHLLEIELDVDIVEDMISILVVIVTNQQQEELYIVNLVR